MDNPHPSTRAKGNGSSPLRSAILLGLGLAILVLAAVVILWLPGKEAPTQVGAPAESAAMPPAAPDAPESAAPTLIVTQSATAEQDVRSQLDESEPFFRIGDPVELRRQNGIVDKGILTGFAGAGTDPVAVVATATGEIGVPLAILDESSRRRIDPEYRKWALRQEHAAEQPAGE